MSHVATVAECDQILRPVVLRVVVDVMHRHLAAVHSRLTRDTAKLVPLANQYLQILPESALVGAQRATRVVRVPRSCHTQRMRAIRALPRAVSPTRPRLHTHRRPALADPGLDVRCSLGFPATLHRAEHSRGLRRTRSELDRAPCAILHDGDLYASLVLRLGRALP